MTSQLQAVQSAFLQARRDPGLARALLHQPVTQLAALGIQIPGAADAVVAAAIFTGAPKAYELLLNMMNSPQTVDLEPGDYCAACQWLATAFGQAVFAAAKTAAGAPFRGNDPVIVSIAGVFGSNSAAVAMAMNNFMAGNPGDSPAALGYAICRTAGIC